MSMPTIDARKRREALLKARGHSQMVMTFGAGDVSLELWSLIETESWAKDRELPPDQRTSYWKILDDLKKTTDAEAVTAIQEAVSEGIVKPVDGHEGQFQAVAPEDQPTNSLAGVRLSKWICIRDDYNDHCAMRVMEGTDPSVVDNRVAFIEKTGRVLHNGEWVQLHKGDGGEGPDYEEQEIYGFDPVTREECDRYLRRFGAILPEGPSRETEYVDPPKQAPGR
jgi:hypothetical protein